ncbi:DivIVA domain-containing protein [Microbacterium oleivorans]|uniref:DivIVA domain repeat protein n=1 Tax=Microbacterium oleivorans TaxID=273677 RepID=A0A031G049_9MICO|nr:DivIVA domain-containing protein [Microbacterium oleivorans]AZS43936.1 Cell cycle protein GpsB [Microbacterium oleivorans]EZP29851.1 DivIVA domain repeat protein [Microbacterium oleivorans]THE07244.1 DivIVA domain-containing protein [Microbacterium oleivorans]
MSELTSTAAFLTTPGRRKGYEPNAVDAFLASARAAFEADDATLTSDDIRAAAFPLVREGYAVDAVDAALARIEDAFAQRERAAAMSQRGARAWVGASRALAQEILNRLSRPARHRFRRVSPLRFGYRVDEVDLVAGRIARYLEAGEGLTIEQVRTVAFRMQLRGYDEAQVDAVLDSVVDVMQSVG